MKIIVNNSSMQPIYEQIVERIKNEILTGTAREGEALPSVRALAKDLKISALTVKKAYDLLEEEGLIATVHGKGSFILPANPSLLEEACRREVEECLEEAVQKGRSCGMSDAELRELFALVLEP
ncbi:MAG: GntR family transcriptional regulator [Roseburia sp.]